VRVRWCVQKLGHLLGTDTFPCKQIFENLRVQRRGATSNLKKNTKQQQQQMTAQIVGIEMKLIWHLFVYHYNPVNGANSILNRMQVSLVLGESAK